MNCNTDGFVVLPLSATCFDEHKCLTVTDFGIFESFSARMARIGKGTRSEKDSRDEDGHDVLADQIVRLAIEIFKR